MLEVQIKDPRLFEKFKEFATYKSELTKVAEFPDTMLDELKQYGILGEEEKIEEAKKPVLRIKGQTMSIDNPTKEILVFLGNTMENDYEISIRFMDRVRMLIYSNVVDVDQSFLSFYSHLDGSEPLSELLYGDKNYRRKPSLQKVLEEREGTDKKFKINETFLLDEEMIRYKDVSYMTAELKFTTNLIKNENKGYHIEGIDRNGKKYYLSMYSRPNYLESQLLHVGSITKIAFTSQQTRGMKIYVSGFEIIPRDMEMKLVRIYSPRTRMISTEYFRILYDELRFRMELTEDNKLTPRSNMKGQYAAQGIFE